MLYWLLIAGIFAACNNQQETKDNKDDAAAPAWRTGVALYSFHNLPFEEAIGKVDSGHIKYMEGFSFYKLGKQYNDTTMGDLSPAQIIAMKERIRQANVTMVSMYVGGGNTVEEWKKTFEMAKAFELEFITCEPAREQWDMIDSLAGVYQIKVALHNHAKEISVYWHPDTVLAAIKNHPNFGACADIGHWVRSGLEPAECLKMLKGNMLALHVKDVDKFGNKDAADVMVGTGVIDFSKVVAELKSQDYKGMLYMECEHNFGTNLPDIIQSIKYVDSLARN